MIDFVVEDGTDVPNANAYISVEYADAYFENKGISDWGELTLAAKQSRIIMGGTITSNMMTINDILSVLFIAKYLNISF